MLRVGRPELEGVSLTRIRRRMGGVGRKGASCRGLRLYGEDEGTRVGRSSPSACGICGTVIRYSRTFSASGLRRLLGLSRVRRRAPLEMLEEHTSGVHVGRIGRLSCRVVSSGRFDVHVGARNKLCVGRLVSKSRKEDRPGMDRVLNIGTVYRRLSMVRMDRG